jgi:hypothetical protein
MEFQPGFADFSPGWFMLGHEVNMISFLVVPRSAETIFHQTLEFDLYVSTELRTKEAANFLRCVQTAETLLNYIGRLVCPEMFSAGIEAISKLQTGEGLDKTFDNIALWPSFFSGIEVISNRDTDQHRDQFSSPPVYDFLLSAGKHRNAWLQLADINASLSYDPGTVVALCGKILHHGVSPGWEGERICIAHFIRDNVHDRLKVQRPGWVTVKQFWEAMDQDCFARQKWPAVYKAVNGL